MRPLQLTAARKRRLLPRMSTGELSPEAWRGLGRDVQLLGRRLFVADLQRGPGVPLLALHGFPTCSWDWAPIAERLAEGRRFVAPDLLGFGHSEKPRGPYTVALQADLVLALLRSLQLEEIDLLAHDLGDTVACELFQRLRASGAGPRLRRVALLNGGLFPELHRPVLVQRLLRSPLRGAVPLLLGRRSFGRAFSAVFGPQTQPTAAQLDEHFALLSRDGGLANYPALAHYLAEREQHRARWVPALVELPVPLRLVWGDADPVAVWPIAARVLAERPATSLVRLGGIGHYPQLEAPERVVAALLDHFA